MKPPDSERVAVGVDFLAALVAAAALAVADAIGVALRPPGGVGSTALAVLLAIGAPLGALLGAAVLVPRGLLSRVLARRGGWAGAMLAGALDGALLFVLGVVAQDPRLVSGSNQRAAALGLGLAGAAACAALWHWFVRPRPRLAVVVAAAAAAYALLAESQLRWNGDVWTRVALGLLFAAGLGRAALPLLRRIRPRAALVAAGACVPLAALAWGPLLGASQASRYVLYHRSTHVRGWTYAVERVVARGSDDGLGDPGRGREQARPPARALRGVAAGSDVLLLSLDSLRWDASGELRRVREALGDHVEFPLAVSPAPATRESLAATVRGRAPHELALEATPGVRGRTLWRDPSPTLGHELARAGYRAVTIATHSATADPRYGVQAGFETLWIAGFDARGRFPRRSPFSPMPRSADEVLPIARRVARETPGPLLLWLHLMEPHQPYYWAPGRAGPNGHDAFLRSVRYSDGLVAGVLRDLRAARRRPLVVAVYGDHGEEFGEHGGEFHGSSVHAEQVRVALLLAAPGLPAARPAAPVSLAALPATILDLLGRPVPASMTEPSLAAALAGEAPFPQVAASEMSSAYCTAVGYTSERWRLVRDPVHDVDRLYDLVRDPYERRDLAASRPRDLAAMRRLARQWDEAR